MVDFKKMLKTKSAATKKKKDQTAVDVLMNNFKIQKAVQKALAAGNVLMTNRKLKTQKDKNDKIIRDENGDPVKKLTAPRAIQSWFANGKFTPRVKSRSVFGNDKDDNPIGLDYEVGKEDETLDAFIEAVNNGDLDDDLAVAQKVWEADNEVLSENRKKKP